MKARKVTNDTISDYDSAMKQFSKSQYADFYDICKKQQKSKDPEIRLRYKTLEKCYKLLQSRGIPFNIAQDVYPKMCKIYGEFCVENAKIIEAKKNGQS